VSLQFRMRNCRDTISGAKSKRHGLDQLLADARRRRFDVVLVAAFDRVARSVRHLLEVLDELNHLNIEFAGKHRHWRAIGTCDGRNRWSDCRIGEKFNR